MHDAELRADVARLQAERDKLEVDNVDLIFRLNSADQGSAWAHAEVARLEAERAEVKQDRDSWRRVCERLETEKVAALAERDEARARANEAARLSAEAWDLADDLRKLIADLREEVAIIDESRTEMLVIQLRLEQERDEARAARPGRCGDVAPEILAGICTGAVCVLDHGHPSDWHEDGDGSRWVYRSRKSYAVDLRREQRDEARAELSKVRSSLKAWRTAPRSSINTADHVLIAAVDQMAARTGDGTPDDGWAEDLYDDDRLPDG